MAFVDYYELIGVPQDADAETIKTAIRKTRKRFRQLSGAPDVNQRQMAETKMTQIAEAEKTLLDDQARRQYDQQYGQQSSQPEPAPETGSGSTTSFLDDALDYYRNGQLRVAASASKEATREEKDNPYAWYVRAQISLEMEDYSDAEFAASQSLKLDSKNASIYGVLGDVADRTGRYADVERYFTEAAKLEPEKSYWTGRIIVALVDQHRVADALNMAKSLYEKHPQEDYTKNVYISVLFQDIEWAAAHDDDGHYTYTNPKQIEYARKQIAVIHSIGVPADNRDFQEELSKHEAFVEQAAKRKFIWPSVGYIAGRIILWFILFTVICGFIFSKNELLSSVSFLVITGGLIYEAFQRMFPYQWKLNADANPEMAAKGLKA